MSSPRFSSMVPRIRPLTTSMSETWMGLLVFQQGRVMDARVRDFDAAEHGLVEVAELLSAESGGAATDSGDLDVGAIVDWHISPGGALANCFVVLS